MLTELSVVEQREGTVKSHVKGIFRKLGAKDRAQVVSIALREGVSGS